ncbi:tagaturonate reductase [Cellulomonas triticagri]|uniref:Tagaturonate reductase n=1 Tax=Cellulomonas triticagri TaxID=2483352 RepID=A0A3M2J6C7_9CELL|nr:tagaturonate reductase [Cellulomonas triticagri]RMI09667.1 tagaturonate reductase [Cellulomonas triticagri]
MTPTPAAPAAGPARSAPEASGLPHVDATTVARGPLPVSVLQVGGGNFLRAFVDQMVQRAVDAGVMTSGITVVHATPGPDRAVDLLREQDGMYHVLLEGVRDGEPVREVTRVTAIRGVVRAHEQFDAYREAYLSPDLRVLVSNTTEAGIAWVPGEDLTARPPASFPAKVTALLLDRFRHFDGDPAAGLHVVCCELIEDNASTLRRYVLAHAAEHDLPAEFVAWVDEACTFHDTLVDRIVPGYPRDEIDAVQAGIGYADQLVVKGELYGTWVIGGDAGLRDLLPLDRAGLPVDFVDDVRPVRDRKVRVLNGLHTALTPLGLLLGCTTVRETAERTDVARYLDRLLDAEVLPSLPGDPDALRAYAAGIRERFTNPYLEHRLADIALNALSKYRARNLPVLLDAWAAGRDAPATALALAALLVLDSGRRGPAGFEPADDPVLLALVRDTCDEDDLPGWVRGVVVGTGMLPADDPRLDRLVAEVAGHAAVLLADGAAAALAGLPSPDPTAG